MDKENELINLLDEIKRRLAKLEGESRVGLEDQLFFGLIFSLALFTITLDLTQTTSFFETFFKLGYDIAMRVSLFIKSISILILLLGCILRYYGAIRPHKGARLASFACLIAGLNFFLLAFIMFAFQGLAISIYPMNFPFSMLILFFLYMAIGKFIEGGILEFYSRRKIILKKYQTPIISPIFANICASFYIAWIVGFVTAFYDVSMASLLFPIALVTSYIVLSILYIVYLRRQPILR